VTPRAPHVEGHLLIATELNVWIVDGFNRRRVTSLLALVDDRRTAEEPPT